jgi:hypothetical protein
VTFSALRCHFRRVAAADLVRLRCQLGQRGWTPSAPGRGAVAHRASGGRSGGNEDWFGLAADQWRRATIRHAPPRRHRQARRLVHVGIGAPAEAGGRRAVHQLAAVHRALGYRNRRSWPSGAWPPRICCTCDAKRARRADGRSRPAGASPPRHDRFGLAAGGAEQRSAPGHGRRPIQELRQIPGMPHQGPRDRRRSRRTERQETDNAEPTNRTTATFVD